MNVQLPESGCNILTNATTFYNYSDDNLQRDTYVIYEGVAHKTASNYSNYGYQYSGTCLNTGDLVYKPEYKDVLFPIFSIIIALFLFYGAYKLMLSHWWRYK